MLFRKCSSGKPSHNIGVFFNTIDPDLTLHFEHISSGEFDVTRMAFPRN